MKLVIVESPNKVAHISEFLGKDYQVDASVGHIRDLAISGKEGLGVDINNDFKPTYKVSSDKTKIVAKLKKDVKNASEVYLATDPDREGEAISWHLAEVLGLDVNTTKRVEFHEITKKAVLKGLDNPRTINMDLVSSQEARRIIDRIMGFKLSSLLKNKIKSESAGRVQSVALRLITDREKERNNFVSEEYYSIEGLFDEKYKASLTTYKGNKVEINSLTEANDILSKIGTDFVVSDFEAKEKITYPKKPFKTSSLQIEGGRKFKMSSAQIQRAAQNLFEEGLITYIRTEGETIARDFIDESKNYVISNFGNNYLASAGKLSSLENKTDSAHEAIRPTSLDLTPERAKAEYNLDAYLLKVYRLIYNRTLASLMAPCVEEVTTVYFVSNDYGFRYTFSKTISDGFTKVYNLEEDETKILNAKPGDHISGAVEIATHHTEPPAQFSEATLVKTMEDEGIGRPSTYASTIETLFKRKYISEDKAKMLTPSDQGILTSDVLKEYFAPFMETTYTSKMEKDLDEIKFNDGSEKKVIQNFYDEFEPLYNNARENMEKVPVQLEYSGNNCPLCGSPLVYRKSRFGKFEACSNYPACKYIVKQEKQPLEYLDGQVCPKCGKPLVKRKSKKGEFYACSGFPKCRYILGQEENKESAPNAEITDLICPKCGKPLIRRKGVKGKSDFYGCSNFPRCRYSKAIEE